MKLVLYSGGDHIQNEEVNLRTSKLFRSDNVQIAFIPSSTNEDTREGSKYFDAMKLNYKDYGIKSFIYSPIDIELSDKEVRNIFNSDGIYLSGGNTFYFLNSIKERKLEDKLAKFVKDGGVLIGVSAGSLIQASDIEIANIGKGFDENAVKLTDLSSLNLVPFYIYPHFEGDRKLKEELLEYSKRIDKPVYAYSDGAGIVIEGDKTEMYGKITMFMNGVISVINN